MFNMHVPVHTIMRPFYKIIFYLVIIIVDTDTEIVIVFDIIQIANFW